MNLRFSPFVCQGCGHPVFVDLDQKTGSFIQEGNHELCWKICIEKAIQSDLELRQNCVRIMEEAKKRMIQPDGEYYHAEPCKNCVIIAEQYRKFRNDMRDLISILNKALIHTALNLGCDISRYKDIREAVVAILDDPRLRELDGYVPAKD